MLQIYSNQTINPRKTAKNSPKWAKLRLCYVFGHTISSGFVHFILIYIVKVSDLVPNGLNYHKPNAIKLA